MNTDRAPFSSLTPKEDTGAAEFLRRHPKFDGKGVIIAILDTGVDPGTAGLQVTSDGKQKIVDLIDATGSGDVCTKKIVSSEEELGRKFVRGISGRKLFLNPAWVNPSGKWRVGLKAGYDLYPKKLIRRISKLRQDENSESLAESLSLAMKQRAEISSIPTPGTAEFDRLNELDARVALLQSLIKSPIDDEDLGPMYDIVAWEDDKGKWRVALDTFGTGDLSNAPGFTNFRDEYQWGVLDPVTLLNYSVNIYNNGDVVSIVTEAGTHGTHVASIAAAYFPDAPDTSGVAPGAQIVGIKIGDHRLGSMETGNGLQRGLTAIVESGAHIVNMSYGEYTANGVYGEIMRQIDHLVLEKKRIFVSSAGNNGPAISTVGCPGGSHKWVIGVAAAVSAPMMDDQYSLRSRFTENTKAPTTEVPTPCLTDTTPVPGATVSDPSSPALGPSAFDYYESEYNERSKDTCYTWSSRGPSALGHLGVSCTASGGASTYVPPWNLQKIELMNGTSMSSPNATGSMALLLSGLLQSNIPFTPATVRRAIENTATPISNTPDHFSGGYGMLNIPQAWTHLVLNHVLSVVKAGNLHPALFQNYFTQQQSAGTSTTPATTITGGAEIRATRQPSKQDSRAPGTAPGTLSPPRSPSLSEVNSYYLITPDDYVPVTTQLPQSAGTPGAATDTAEGGVAGAVSAGYPYRKPSAPGVAQGVLSDPGASGFSLATLLAPHLVPPIDVQVLDHGKNAYGKIFGGVYRREPGTTTAPFDAVVSFVPYFSSDVTSAQKLDVDYRLKIFSTDTRWVQTPTHATMNSTDKTISVHVNPLPLEGGTIHFAQVQAFEMFTNSMGQKRLQTNSPLFTQFLHAKDLQEYIPAQRLKLESESVAATGHSPALTHWDTLFPTATWPAELSVNALAFALGPLVRVPVTLVLSDKTVPNYQNEYKYPFYSRPEEILPMEKQLKAQNITLAQNVLPTKAGTLFRRFLQVPTGATWMNIEVQRLNTRCYAAVSASQSVDPFTTSVSTQGDAHTQPVHGAVPEDAHSVASHTTDPRYQPAQAVRGGDQSGRMMVLHAMQLVINETPTKTDWSTVNVYREGTTNSFPVPLDPGSDMVEVTLGQYWNSLGPALFQVTVTFQGVVCSHKEITLCGADYPSTPVTLSPVLHEVPIQPKGVLTTLHRTFDPIVPAQPDALAPKILTERDVLCDGSRQYELKLKYKVKLENKERDATMILPVLRDMLYESAYDAYLVLVTNESQRLVATYDMFPKGVALPAGNLNVDIQIRAKDAGLLTKLINEPGCLTLHLVTPLKKDDQVQLRFSLTPPGVNAGGVPASSPSPLVQPINVFINRPSVPKGVNTGDILSGYVLWDSYTDITHRMSLSHADTPAQEAGRHPKGTPITYVVHAPDLKKKVKGTIDESYLEAGRTVLEGLYERAMMKGYDELVASIQKLDPFAKDLMVMKPQKSVTVEEETLLLDNGPLKVTETALKMAGIQNSTTDTTSNAFVSVSAATSPAADSKGPDIVSPTLHPHAFEEFFRAIRTMYTKALPLLKSRLDAFYTAYTNALKANKSKIIEALLKHAQANAKKEATTPTPGLGLPTLTAFSGVSSAATLESLLPGVHRLLRQHTEFVRTAANELIAHIDQERVAGYFGRVRNADTLTPGSKDWHIHQERVEENDALLYAYSKLALVQLSHTTLIPELITRYREHIPYIRPESPISTPGTTLVSTSASVRTANKWFHSTPKGNSSSSGGGGGGGGGLTLPLLPHNFFSWTSLSDLQKSDQLYSEWKRSKDKTVTDTIAFELSLRKFMYANAVQSVNKALAKNSITKEAYAGLSDEDLGAIRTAAFLYLQLPLLACRSNEHATASFAQNNAFF